MPNVMLFGPPGSGKGTQSELLKAQGYYHVSTGDLLRAEAEEPTEQGRMLKEMLARGDFAPDQVTIGLIEKATEGRDDVIFDGFPRNIVQAEALDVMLAQRGKKIDVVFNLDVPDDVLLQRIINRKSGRADDRPEVFPQRMANYHQKTAPVLEHYRDRVMKLDGTESPEDVFEIISCSLRVKCCSLCGENKILLDFPKKKSCKWGFNSRCKDCHNAQCRLSYTDTKGKDQAYLKKLLRSKPAYKMVSRAKDRARKLGLPFDLDWKTIEVPEKCPVLGIPLRVADGVFDDNSPSLDRRQPHLGYVMSNVEVISYRANRIKNDATASELRAIADWLEKHNAR